MATENQKTTIYLPPDLFVLIRNRAKTKGVSVQDVIRDCLITAMEWEDGGFEERINQHEAKWNAEQERMRAQLDAFIAKHDAPPAAKASEPAHKAKIKGLKGGKTPDDEATPKASEAA